MCGARGSRRIYNGVIEDDAHRLRCELQAGHMGWHECDTFDHLMPGQLGAAIAVRWEFSP